MNPDPSEVEKYEHLIRPYCLENGQAAPGLDIASGGRPCVPWAFNLELPKEDYDIYNSGHPARGPIQLRGHVDKLPIEDASLWFVCASHIAEDFPQSEWTPLFSEWARVLRPGGYLIVLVPEHELWWAYVRNGGIHNQAHAQPQPAPGDMSKVATALGLEVVKDELTNCYEGDPNILGVFRKP